MKVGEGIDARERTHGTVYRARVWDPRAGRHVSRSFDTLKEAKRWRDLARGEVARRKRIAAPNRTLRQVAEEWLADLETGKARNARGAVFAPETAARYASHLERLVLPYFGGAKVGAIQRKHVQRWLDELAAGGRGASDRKNALKPLAAIFRRLVDAGDLADSPTRNIRVERPRNRQDRIEDPDDAEMRIPAMSEVRLLLEALPPHPRAVFAIAMFAGLRVGELRALDWSAVDLDAGVLRVEWQLQPSGKRLPKSQRRRVVPVIGPLRGELALWALASGRRDGLVLGSTARDPFTPRWVQQQADRAWQEAGLLRLTPHMARHVFASTLAAAGVPGDDISRWLGQASESVRAIYTHEAPGAQARARERVEMLMGHQ